MHPARITSDSQKMSGRLWSQYTMIQPKPVNGKAPQRKSNVMQVRGSNRALSEAFSVTEYPTLLAICNGDPALAVPYKGELKAEKIAAFLVRSGVRTVIIKAQVACESSGPSVCATRLSRHVNVGDLQARPTFSCDCASCGV